MNSHLLSTGKAMRPLSVFVVDDNADGAYLLGHLLKMWGHVAFVANDPHTAITLAEANSPDVFILDVNLPGMDAYDLGLRLRSHHPHAAYIGYSGLPRDSQREAEVGFSFDYFLSKPMPFNELEKLLALIKG
jgi:CheY-like chemotaxis protein